jgi:haloalkane dehalogenase
VKNGKNPSLFTIPKVLEGPWRLHYPFKSNYLKVSNGLLHYLDEGSGEPLVMLHGNPTWSFMFRKLILNFRGGFRCIAPDHMGMGLSSRTEETLTLKDRIEDLENLLEKLQIKEKINLIGHDWGGTIALGYAVRQPQKVKTLILMNTGLKLPESVKIPLRLKLFQFNPVFTNILAVSLGLFTKGL